ncbi:uncharacterized protein LOC115704688 [Cannabis sativa]|uniref:uncharacterized protein LOC115704688 n=1 Tax=Cannabis sativa TaxID=3483 RepID=UPI0011DFD372|nr:uncharacterized protein LOC115704688 [Cannabis sativa]
MRIRKNAKVSPLLFSSHASAPEVLQSHVCQLNQSPWDVIPFAQYSFSNQTEGDEDSFTGNGSLGDSNIGAVESVSSLMDVGEDPIMIIKDNNNDDIIVKNDNNIIYKQLSNDNELHRASSSSTVVGEVLLLCQKNDGKGWQCKKRAKDGYSFCHHHLTLLRSYAHNTNNSTNYDTTITTTSTSTKAKSAAVDATGVRRTRGRAAATKKGLNNSTNPYEFYYYSGFGPLWGRKRGERGEVRAATVAAAEEENSDSSDHSPPPPRPPSSSNTTTLMDNDEFDYDFDDDEDDEDTASGDNGKKRMRKPVKARSLKSLM